MQQQTPHHWTDEEVQFVTRHYDGTTKSNRIIARYLGIPRIVLSRKTTKLGLAKPVRPSKPWADEERQAVRREWDGTNATKQRLAKRLGRTKPSIRAMAITLGVHVPKPPPNWTPEQDEQLRDLIGRYNPEEIASKMHRTPTAIIVRSKRINISRGFRDGWYTMAETSHTLGVDHKVVLAWIQCGALRAKRHHPESHYPKPSQNVWHIQLDDLREFIIEHADLLHAPSVDLPAIIYILDDPIADAERRSTNHRGRPAT